VSTFYLDPQTGALYAESRPARGVVQLPGVFVVGVTAPVVIDCMLHGFEAHMSVVGLGHRGRNVQGPHTFARCALAAAAGSCRQYRAWEAGLADDITRIPQRTSEISWSTQSWRALRAAISQRVEFLEAMRALAAIELPQLSQEEASAIALPQPPRAVTGVNYALHRASGTISVIASHQCPPGYVRLPYDGGAWIATRCRDHGWDLYDEIPALSGQDWEAVISDFAVVTAADSARSCEELYARFYSLAEFAEKIVLSPNEVRGASAGLGTLQHARAVADIIAKVCGDFAWPAMQGLIRVTRDSDSSPPP
jgi:hypothetical protein